MKKKLEKIIERRTFINNWLIQFYQFMMMSYQVQQIQSLQKRNERIASSLKIGIQKQRTGKIGQKSLIIDGRNPLQESRKSPFLSQLRLYQSSEGIDLSASQDIDPNFKNIVVLNENLRGFGSRQRSYFDYDKNTVFKRQKGNPKNIYLEII
ncbi:unnamed protein product [Paramecium sonneborni]|uniref:Uncharacterized protein n=1 Tax=Paramecium sonneborni TaxID=65129 RepID=A0A8S1RBW6_9CILI|nr:unnamed protein product [Paramecium sonneborni]